MHPDAETQILSLAWPLEEPERSAFITVASQAVEKLGLNAYGPGAVHRLLAPLWSQFFRPPSETSPTNRSRAYLLDDGEASALTKFALEGSPADRGGPAVRYRRKPVAGYAS